MDALVWHSLFESTGAGVQRDDEGLVFRDSAVTETGLTRGRENGKGALSEQQQCLNRGPPVSFASFPATRFFPTEGCWLEWMVKAEVCLANLRDGLIAQCVWLCIKRRMPKVFRLKIGRFTGCGALRRANLWRKINNGRTDPFLDPFRNRNRCHRFGSGRTFQHSETIVSIPLTADVQQWLLVQNHNPTFLDVSHQARAYDVIILGLFISEKVLNDKQESLASL